MNPARELSPAAGSSRGVTVAALTVGFLLAATSALADPCEAIPDRGTMPTYLHRGETFSGPVVYVGDGDSLCVDVGGAQSRRFRPFGANSANNIPRSQTDNDADGVAPKKGFTWVEIRLADYYAPELHDAGGEDAKRALSRLVMGKRLVCFAQHRSYDRIVASCQLNGRDLGDMLRSDGIAEGGRGWKGGAR